MYCPVNYITILLNYKITRPMSCSNFMTLPSLWNKNNSNLVLLLRIQIQINEQHYNSSIFFREPLKVLLKTCLTFYKYNQTELLRFGLTAPSEISSLTQARPSMEPLVWFSFVGYASEVMVLVHIRIIFKFCSSYLPACTVTLIGPTQRCQRPPISPAAHWGGSKSCTWWLHWFAMQFQFLASQ